MSDIIIFAGSAVAGAALGAVHLTLVWVAARSITGPQVGLVFAALALARVALLIAALWLAVTLGAGAGALVAALAGFLALRGLAIRRVGGGGARAGGEWK